MKKNQYIPALEQYFGFTSFRDGQSEIIDHIIKGENALVVMPTGSGKSLCYQLPALLSSGLTMVVSPLIALMKDQVDDLQKKGIPATFINSSISSDQQNLRLKQVLNGEIKILYIAPERFRVASFRPFLKKMNIKIFAVDEAHCISHWGHDFRPDYMLLHEIIKELDSPSVVALTATATRQVQKDILERLDIERAKSFVTGFNRPNLKFSVIKVFGDAQKFQFLEEQVTSCHGSIVIYAGTRKKCEEITHFLTAVLGIKAGFYHAGLSAEERSAIQNDFMKSKLQVIVATNAFGMGVDKPDIRLVCHYQIPGSVEAYYQETGRAGRDGKDAKCVLFYDPSDYNLQEWFIENSRVSYTELLFLYNYFLKKSEKGVTAINLETLALDSPDMNEVKGRVGIRHLENAGVIKIIDSDFNNIRLNMFKLDLNKVKKVAGSITIHADHKYKQLKQMIEYAGSFRCRRKLLLGYFGADLDAPVENCCDNCDRKKQTVIRKTSSRSNYQADRIEQAIINFVAHHWCGLGVKKIAQVLTGSKDLAITKSGHHESEYYGLLRDVGRADIEQTVNDLMTLGLLERDYLNDFPVIALTPDGMDVFKTIQNKNSVKKASVASDHYQTILELVQEGKSPEAVATHTNLPLSEIYKDITHAIGQGNLQIDRFVPQKHIKQMQSALNYTGTLKFRSIRDILPGKIQNYEIEMFIALKNGGTNI